MSGSTVDFSLVRYSPVEGTHYFFDPAYPTSIQFLLNGQWESWDVGWVKKYVNYRDINTEDPGIKRIAEDAEARLLREQAPGYYQWPDNPPPNPSAHGGSPELPLESPLLSPRTQHYLENFHVSEHLGLSPARAPARAPAPRGASPESLQSHRSPSSQPPPASYVSRYGAIPATTADHTSLIRNRLSTSTSNHIISGTSAASLAPFPAVESLLNLSNRVQQPESPFFEPERDLDIDLNIDPMFGSNVESENELEHELQEEPQHEAPLQAQPQTHPSQLQPSQPSQPPTVPLRLLARNRETKILLSLDGDGIRGLSQVLLVESLVHAICTKIGIQIDPYLIFDLIGGTSMGGIFAIMLSRLRMQVHSAREAYKIIAKEAFQDKQAFFTSFDPHAPPVTRDGQSFETAMKALVTVAVGNEDEVLYDSREDSANVFIVSTRIDIGTTKAALIRSYQTSRIIGPEVDANITIWQAMQATAAAPRYKKSRSGVNGGHVLEFGTVDHGTAKNNPVRDLLYEFRKLYRYANDMMIIVSIGPGTGFNYERELPEMGKNVIERTREARARREQFEADHEAMMAKGWMQYFRFDVPDLDDIPLEEWNLEHQIREKTTRYLARPEVAQMFYACVDAITDTMLGELRPRR